MFSRGLGFEGSRVWGIGSLLFEGLIDDIKPALPIIRKIP